jgi:hypothetical protein
VAVYGFARTFLFLEFFYGAPRWVIAFKGVFLLAIVFWLAWRAAVIRGRAPHAVPRFGLALAPFLLLQAAVGVRFFGSDTERWIFIAPAVWLALGAWVPGLSRAREWWGVSADGRSLENAEIGSPPTLSENVPSPTPIGRRDRGWDWRTS